MVGIYVYNSLFSERHKVQSVEECHQQIISLSYGPLAVITLTPIGLVLWYFQESCQSVYYFISSDFLSHNC